METRSKAEIEQTLTRQIAIILGTDPAKIGPEVPLPALGLDSMGFVELLVYVEKTFNLRLIESSLTREDFETIRALAACIVARGARA